MRVQLPGGAATGVGSLPHADAEAAAEFVLATTPDLPAIPTLPRRTHAETMIAQAAVGIRGVTIEADGTLVVDRGRLDPDADVVTDVNDEAFGGWRAFLAAAAARRRTGPVKWQFTGPVTFGLALVDAGVAPPLAFRVSLQAVRAHVTALQRVVAEALPGCPQAVVLDEPGMGGLLRPGFPLAPDAAIDLLSGALAAVEPSAIPGVHCCANADWAALLAAGPALVSLPATAAALEAAGYLSSFLDSGGWVAWGAVPTDSPVSRSPERYWKELAHLWCELVRSGCDALRLRYQALVTPACGLGLHDVGQAEQVVALVDAVARQVHSQAVATRITIGA